MKKVCIIMLIASMFCSMLLGGCSTTPQSSSPAASSVVSSSAGSSAAPAPSSTAAKKEVVFTFSRAEDIQKWDPQNNYNLVNILVNHCIYNTLVKSDDRKGKFSGELATEWSVSPDGKAWTFKLRKGVKFHNGEEFDATSVKVTMERLIKEPNLAQVVNWKELEGVDTPDQYTAVIKLKNPSGSILTLLADAPMLPPKALTEKGAKLFDENIGTGPWKFVQWVPGQKIVMAKNPNYWEGEVSNVDKIVYMPIMEDTTRISGVRTGDIDMADGIPNDQVKMLSSQSGIKVVEMMSADQIYMGFKTDKGPFASKDARIAANLAIDRKLIVDSILGGGRASSWPVGDCVMGFDPNAKVPEYNVKLAKESLAKSGYNGQTIRMIAPNGWYPRTKEVMQAIASMLTEVGFKVNLEVLEGAAFSERRGAGEYDLYYTGCSMTLGDPFTFITQRWKDDTMKSGYVNPKLNDLITASNRESDTAKRNVLLRDAMQIVVDEVAPHGFVYQISAAVAMRDTVSNVKVFGDKICDFSKVMKK